jgi:hypothetical protein
MQKHIRYEIEVIADPFDAPSLAQVTSFFEKAIYIPTPPQYQQAEDQSKSRRGRPKKSPPAAAPISPPTSNRPEEQLFTIRRTDTPVDVYFGELDEAVEKLKATPSPPQPAPWANPKWFETYPTYPLPVWQPSPSPSPSPTCASKDPKFTISGVSYLPGEPFPAAQIHAPEIDEQVTREDLQKLAAQIQPQQLSEIDETA